MRSRRFKNLWEAREPINRGEKDLADIMVQAGLPQFEHQRVIDLGKPLGTTIPDLEVILLFLS